MLKSEPFKVEKWTVKMLQKWTAKLEKWTVSMVHKEYKRNISWHKFTRNSQGEQVKVLLTAYKEGHITREEIEKTLGLGKTRFFALLKQIRWKSQGTFPSNTNPKAKWRLGSDIEEKIRVALFRDKELVDDKELPISGYNYAAVNDRLKKKG